VGAHDDPWDVAGARSPGAAETRAGSRSRSVTWHGRNNSGHLVNPGTYHFRVRLNEYGTTHYGGRARITVR